CMRTCTPERITYIRTHTHTHTHTQTYQIAHSYNTIHYNLPHFLPFYSHTHTHTHALVQEAKPTRGFWIDTHTHTLTHSLTHTHSHKHTHSHTPTFPIPQSRSAERSVGTEC